MSAIPQHVSFQKEKIQTLEFYLDCEILKLLHQMKAGETLDINVVDHSQKISEIHAARKKTKVDRDVSVLSIKGNDILQIIPGGLARCLLGEQVNDDADRDLRKDVLPAQESVHLQSGRNAPQTDAKGTQTEISLKDINALADSRKRTPKPKAISMTNAKNIQTDISMKEIHAFAKQSTSGSVGRKRKSEVPKKQSQKSGTQQCESALEGLTVEEGENAEKDGSLSLETTGSLGLGVKIQRKLSDAEVPAASNTTEVITTKRGRTVKTPANLQNSATFGGDDENPPEEIFATEEKADPSFKQEVESEGNQSETDNAVVPRKPLKKYNEGKKRREGRVPRQCPVCGKMVANFAAHAESHTGPVSCPKCDKKFVKTCHLYRHIKTIHEQKFPFSCEHCGKGYSWKKQMLEHVEHVHKKGKPDQKTFFPRIHQCEYCAKTFKTNSHLQVHINAVHKQIRKFECNLCDKKFTKQYHLNVHLRVHSGEKPFLCSFCGKGFTDKSNMDVHTQSVHLHVLPYKCKECGKGFRRKKFLTIHAEHGCTGSSATTSVASSSYPPIRVPIRKATAVKKTRPKKKDYQLIHVPNDILDAYQSSLNNPDDQSIVVLQPEYNQDALKLAVEQITKSDSNMSGSDLEQESSARPSKSVPSLNPDSTFNVQIRTMTNADGVQNVVQSMITTDGSPSSQLSQLSQAKQVLSVLQSGSSGNASASAASAEGNEKYVLATAADAETLISSEDLQQAVGQLQQLNSLKADGQDQPYFLLQDGALTMLQTLPTDGGPAVNVLTPTS